MSKEKEVIMEKREPGVEPLENHHSDITNDLIALLKEPEHKGWDKLLFNSVKAASERAAQELDDELYEELGKWPLTKEDYYGYLDDVVCMIPGQDYTRATYYQLCKFYFLLDQPAGKELQNIIIEGRQKPGNAFTDWMVKFARDWGNFLSTPGSLTPDSLESFYEDPDYNLWQYVGYEEEPGKRYPSKTWTSFNQFFSREVKPGLRPIAGINSDCIITAPADCTFQDKFYIDDESKIIAPGGDGKVLVKYTHQYDVLDLLEGSPYKDYFRNGLFMHSFLGPSDYHRFHAPVRGTVLECRAIQQEVFLDVTIMPDENKKGKNGLLYALDGTGYQFYQTRGLIVFDSPIGLVAVLPIGMAQVSSVNMTAVEGAYLNKGEEFGYFQFGGSDIIVLFQEDSGVEITAAPNIHTNVGTCVAQVIDNSCY